MIGNGFTDPATMLAYSEYAYQLGLVDSHAREEMRKLEDEGRKAIREGHFVDAFYVSIVATYIHPIRLFASLVAHPSCCSTRCQWPGATFLATGRGPT